MQLPILTKFDESTSISRPLRFDRSTVNPEIDAEFAVMVTTVPCPCLSMYVPTEFVPIRCTVLFNVSNSAYVPEET